MMTDGMLPNKWDSDWCISQQQMDKVWCTKKMSCQEQSDRQMQLVDLVECH